MPSSAITIATMVTHPQNSNRAMHSILLSIAARGKESPVPQPYSEANAGGCSRGGRTGSTARALETTHTVEVITQQSCGSSRARIRA
jgi:hypothetical protein